MNHERFVASGQEPSLKIDQIMTAQELEKNGYIHSLYQQREALYLDRLVHSSILFKG